MKKAKKAEKVKKILTAVCICICLEILDKDGYIFGMQMGGFDIEVGNGENYEWYWQEEEWNWEQQEYFSDTMTENEMQNEEMQMPGDLQWEEPQEDIMPDIQEEYASEQVEYPSEHLSVDTPTLESISETIFEATSEAAPQAIPEPTPEPTLTPILSPTPSPTPVPSFIPTPFPTKKEESVNIKKNLELSKPEKDSSVDMEVDFCVEMTAVPVIHLTAKCCVQVLSLRLNEKECPWHWEKNSICLEQSGEDGENKIELLVILQGNKLVKMTPWIFYL